jgi:hypothetical protein
VAAEDRTPAERAPPVDRACQRLDEAAVISPTMTTSGASRSMSSKPCSNEGVTRPTSRWRMAKLLKQKKAPSDS